MSREYDPNFQSEKVCAIVGQKAVVQNDDGEVLVLRRSKKCSRAGGWDFPGGGVDEHEDPAEGMIREIDEEVGLKIVKMKPVCVVSEKTKNKDYVIMIGYSAISNAMEVRLSWEHDKFVWLQKSKSLKLKLPKFHKELLEKHFEIGFGMTWSMPGN
ncbi:NUDIX hydrolase [Pseudomonadota bacterium]